MRAQPEPSLAQLQDPTQPQRDTLTALLQVDDSTILQLSHLTLPEIRAIKEEIAQILPAGNLPAFVLSGLLKLKGRKVSSERVHRDLTTLLRGISLIPQGLYGVLVATPAAVLYAYQKVLQLAGKDIKSAFPQGTWQFYLQFGLREDTARHANETIGFHRAFPEQSASALAAAAWVCAVLELLYRYDDLLAADWSERVSLRLLAEEAANATLVEQPPFATLRQDWHEACPYHRPPDGTEYVAHRQATFQRFLQERLNALPPAAQDDFARRYQVSLAQELRAYQEQMTILAILNPERYQERKEFIGFWQAAIGFVWQERTYLLPICRRDEQGSPLCYPHGENVTPIPLFALSRGRLCDTARQPVQVDRCGRVYYPDGRFLGNLLPPSPETVLGWMVAILSTPGTGVKPTLDLLLAESPRALQHELRKALPAATQTELAILRRAPIIINWDCMSHALPLAYIRRGRRGIGDHPLTIFRTARSTVFDQSHIFFDGMWGLAVAEIVTDSAIHWYHYLSERSGAPSIITPLQPLNLACSPKMEAAIGAHRRESEAAAESADVDMRRLQRLRKWLQQRGVRLTVNDLLLLYRFFHAADYEPSPAVRQALEAFQSRATTPQASVAWQTIVKTLARQRETNPALLIPMSASNVSPRERIFPATFRNPLTEIRDLFATAHRCYLDCSPQATPKQWTTFDKARRELLAYLKAFGELLDALKAVTMRGESFNTVTIRMLAHLPPSMQHLLDAIPQHIGVLNEIIKGNEVFSNVGRVAPGTSLTRFISAKDDGETKELVWGVLTDNEGRMHISLRDFRPFVPLLLDLGENALAGLLAQDYLATFVQGLNRFVVELGAIVTAQEPK